MFNIVKAIRGKNVTELADVLRQRLDKLEEKLSAVRVWQLGPSNRKAVHHFLARLAHHIQQKAGESSAVGDYLNHTLSSSTKPYEVEHIIPSDFKAFEQSFQTKLEFETMRQRIGNLTLLQRGVNQSLGAGHFTQKYKVYSTSPLMLSRTLTSDAYANQPTFSGYIQSSGHPFVSYTEFGPTQVEERSRLYAGLAVEIWGPERLKVEL